MVELIYKDIIESFGDATTRETINQCELHRSDPRLQRIRAILERILEVSGLRHRNWELSIVEAPGNRQDD